MLHGCLRPASALGLLLLLLLLLYQPPATTIFSSRVFPVAAPTVWNSLHVNTRSAETLVTFRNRLKTELFYYTRLFGVITSLRS